MSEQPGRFLRLPDVLDRVGLGRTKVYEMIGEGSFPPPIKQGRLSLWPESRVVAWQTAVMAAA